MRKKPGIITTLAVVALGVLLSGAVWAHSYHSSSGATINHEQDEGRFWGHVVSPQEECRKGRRIRLEKITQNDLEVVGRTRSNGASEWEISLPEAEGTYWAVVRKRVDTSPGHDHRCRMARSQPFTVQ